MVHRCAYSNKMATDGTTELEYCEQMVEILNDLHLDVFFSCVEAEDCLLAVETGGADIVTLDGGLSSDGSLYRCRL